MSYLPAELEATFGFLIGRANGPRVTGKPEVTLKLALMANAPQAECAHSYGNGSSCTLAVAGLVGILIWAICAPGPSPPDPQDSVGLAFFATDDHDHRNVVSVARSFRSVATGPG